jgi:DNA-binding XRE family transcriptional regulator
LYHKRYKDVPEDYLVYYVIHKNRTYLGGVDVLMERANEQLAARVRHLRRARGLTQQQLADNAGVSRASVARIEGESATPDLSTLAKLAEALGVEVGDLFKG